MECTVYKPQKGRLEMIDVEITEENTTWFRYSRYIGSITRITDWKGDSSSTQCTKVRPYRGEVRLFVIFVNIDKRIGSTHQHKGELAFEHFTFYITPREVVNKLYRDAVQREYARPLIKTGGKRKLGNMAVEITLEQISKYRDAWSLMRQREKSGQA